MATINDVADSLERMEREQKVRDEGLRIAFTTLTAAMNRTNSVLDLIHKEATDARVATGVIQDLLTDLPGQISSALDQMLEATPQDD